MTTLYLDASAFAKLILDEPASGSLIEFISDRPLASSDLLRTELRRAIRRRAEHATPSTQDKLLSEAMDELAAASLIALTPDLLDAAGELPDVALASLDAIHVVTALSIGDEIEGFITYDERQARAARAAGLAVVQPGL